jgi:Ca2+-binding EF-hand superfamily protein
MKELKAKIMARSSAGLKNLAKIFKAIDKNGNGNLDVDDFRWGFIDYGFNLTQEEAKQLLEHFDRDKNGSVNFTEFLMAIKVSLVNLIASGNNERVAQGPCKSSL